MRNLNNKGFAISTLIYGLALMGIMIIAILMATMAQTRSNTSSLVKSIEDELNRYSRTETSFKPIGETIQSQEYVVPTSGWYKIELWGTQGGRSGGKGAYTSGVIELTQGDTLYVYVGVYRPRNPGYATEVRVRNGEYNDDISYETTIMAAAGGGRFHNTADGGTLYGYSDKMYSYGGFINSQVEDGNFSLAALGDDNPTNGSLVGFIKDYNVSSDTNPQAGVKVPSPLGNYGGGCGYFQSNNEKTGGTSFIAGYAGCYGISKGQTKDDISKLEYYEREYVEEETVVTPSYLPTKKGDYYFVDGVMMPGVKTGDGYARIERVKPKLDANSTLKRKNSSLNNVRYIRDCTSTPDVTWDKIVVSVKGNSIHPSLNGTGSCRWIDLGESYDIDELAVFHGNSGVDYKNHYIQVSSDMENWINIKEHGSNTEISETETVTGYRVSAYQYDSTKELPAKGNYIIKPVLSENKVLTSIESSETNANPITIEPYSGSKKQIWTIELITDKKISPGYVENIPSTYEYKIVETSKTKALSITQDENRNYNTVSTLSKFNDKGRNEPQIWKIKVVGNGTYEISTVVAGNGTGNLIAQTNDTVPKYNNNIIVAKNNSTTARFRLIQVDYSSD